jgi:cell division protein FtsQ
MENEWSEGEGWEDDPSGFPNPQSNMDDSVKPQEEKFFRPKQRREVRGGERSQRILRKTIRATSTLLLLSCLLFLGHRVYAHLLENPSFRVRQVELRGCQKVGQETLLSLASIEGMPNLFTLRLKDVARRLESHPWIERVSIQKAFPNKVVIEVKERRPIAIVQMGELYYIDENGVIFCRAGDGDGYNYPFLTGLGRQALEKDSEESKQLIAKALEVLLAVEQEKKDPLKEVSEIYIEKISGIYCISKAEGLEVKMGWDDFREKVRRLSLIWTDLGRRGFTVQSIDCSDVNRMVVKNAMVKNAMVKNAMQERPEATRTVAKRASKRGRFARR